MLISCDMWNEIARAGATHEHTNTRTPTHTHITSGWIKQWVMSNEIELYIHIKKWTDYSAIFRFRRTEVFGPMMNWKWAESSFELIFNENEKNREKYIALKQMFNAYRNKKVPKIKNTDNVSQDWVSVPTSFSWHTYTYKMHGSNREQKKNTTKSWPNWKSERKFGMDRKNTTDRERWSAWQSKNELEKRNA